MPRAGLEQPDRWVTIAGEPGKWVEPSRAIHRGGIIEDAINSLIQTRFRQNLTLTESRSPTTWRGCASRSAVRPARKIIATFISALREIVERHERRVRAA